MDGDSSSDGSYGGVDTFSSDSSSSSYGGSSSYSGYGGATGGYGGDTFSSTSDSDSTTGNYGGISGVGADCSGKVQECYEDIMGVVTDDSSWTGNSDSNSYSGLGVTGGEPCSDSSIADIVNDSLADYDRGFFALYADDTSVQACAKTLDTIQSTWDSASRWVSENITQPLQSVFNQPEGMTKKEVENGLKQAMPHKVDTI